MGSGDTSPAGSRGVVRHMLCTTPLAFNKEL